MTDKIDKILDKLSELHVDVAIIRNDVVHVKEDVRQNTEDLEKLILGVQTNKARLDAEITNIESCKVVQDRLNDQVQSLQKIPNFLFSLMKVSAVLATMTGIFVTISRLI